MAATWETALPNSLAENPAYCPFRRLLAGAVEFSPFFFKLDSKSGNKPLLKDLAASTTADCYRAIRVSRVSF